MRLRTPGPAPRDRCGREEAHRYRIDHGHCCCERREAMIR